ncbi:DUF4349 domain-containing protein [Evansella sp. AB-rgal1]|uniref:DUF4349 domain-containing protein n=1 Tax=Evansella sp. AB-rgal1 TaxID=3242696 RepID=UPI00359E5AC9
MKKITPFLWWFLAILLMTAIFTGCSSSDSNTNEASYDYAYDNDDSDAGFVESEEKSLDRGYTGSDEPMEDNFVDTNERMVIYNADISIEVPDYDRAQLHIQEEVKKLGGFVVESSLHQGSQNNKNGSLTVRVPVKHFHSFLNDLESSSTKVHERYVSGNDVTEEHVDLQSRLRSKRTVEERLLSFMDGAENTEDLLKISNDLSKVQEEIERLTGRIKYLENNVAYSLVSIYIMERNITVSSLQEGESLDTWRKAQSLFMDTVNFMISLFSSIIVVIIGLSPIIIPLIIIIGIIITIQMKKKKKTEDKIE